MMDGRITEDEAKAMQNPRKGLKVPGQLVYIRVYIYHTDTRVMKLADLTLGVSGVIMFVAGLFATPILSWRQVKRLFTRARRR